MNSIDFTPYTDINDVIGYDGFIDRLGNFYKVGLKSKKGYNDTHNVWAQKFMNEKLSIKDFKFNSKTTSALLALLTISGPAEMLVNCYGFVYYSHDPIYYQPIIKLPDPKIANFKATEEQLNMLFSIMLIHRENTNISIFMDEDCYTYPDENENKLHKHVR